MSEGINQAAAYSVEGTVKAVALVRRNRNEESKLEEMKRWVTNPNLHAVRDVFVFELNVEFEIFVTKVRELALKAFYAKFPLESESDDDDDEDSDSPEETDD